MLRGHYFRLELTGSMSSSLDLRSSLAPHPAHRAKVGGGRRDRTDDLMLAKHALSQLSYAPVTRRRMLDRTQKTKGTPGKLVGLGRLELPTSRLSSARSNQLSYKPLTTRGSHAASSRKRHACDCAAPGACSSAKKEKRRRRCPANAAHRILAIGGR